MQYNEITYISGFTYNLHDKLSMFNQGIMHFYEMKIKVILLISNICLSINNKINMLRKKNSNICLKLTRLNLPYAYHILET